MKVLYCRLVQEVQRLEVRVKLQLKSGVCQSAGLDAQTGTLHECPRQSSRPATLLVTAQYLW